MASVSKHRPTDPRHQLKLVTDRTATQLASPAVPVYLASAIRLLDQDDDLCRDLSQRGKARAETFSHANYATRLSDLYQRLV